jgi:dihydroxy-acid dehydratase
MRHASATAARRAPSSSDDGSGKRELRSAAWFGKPDKDGFIHRSWMKNQGLPDHVFDGRPVVGIVQTWSELTPCNAHFRELAERVKRGVWEQGGFPVEFPVMSTGESLMRPTAMLYRNLLAMDTEESIRANPVDGVVLLAGCDKTTPGTVMGALSCDLPTIVLSGGPMLNGKYKGKDIGSGTDVWKFSEGVRAGEMTLADFMEAESCMSRSKGHCNTMGTASTMATLVEALGLTLPGNAAIPAADSRRNAMAHAVGARAVEMIRQDLRPSRVLSTASFENAIRCVAACGGSTNSVVHLLAMANRVRPPPDETNSRDGETLPSPIDVSLGDWGRVGGHLPLLVNLKPAGDRLMEDFFYAGGVPAVLRELLEAGELEGMARTVSGNTIADEVKDAPCYDREVIFPFDKPLQAAAGLAVLRGNLAPDGAIIKPSAASAHLLQHTGKAVVFSSKEDMDRRLDDPDLDVDENSILVLQGAGPVGYPGMPELGNMPLPRKVLQKGITDMVRISDARMSGTAYGTVVLHTAPESAVGGPLAVVQDGDLITLDVRENRLSLDVPDEEIKRRLAAWTRPAPVADRGYAKMYIDTVQQADKGCDFDFLVGSSGAKVPRESH